MEEVKKELLYSIVVKSPNSGEISYQINPELSLGIDPRNDVVLISKIISPKHLVFKLIKNELVLVFTGEHNTTFLNDIYLVNNQNYILSPNDEIKIDQFKIKLKHELGFRILKKEKIEPTIENKSQINQSINGLNLNLNYIEEVATPVETIIRPIETEKRKEVEQNLLIKEASFRLSKKNIISLLYGLIFDFFFSYFVLSIAHQIKVHIYFFFIFLEILFFYSFNASFGQKIMRFKINRQFSIWILIFLFLTYPLSKGEFSTRVDLRSHVKSNILDIHGKSLESLSNKNKLSISSVMDTNLFLFPTIEKDQIIFQFFNLTTKEKLKLEFINVSETDRLNNYLYRTHVFRIPKKETRDPLLLKKFYSDMLITNNENFSYIFKKNGPFLTFINDTKTFFIDGLTGPVELIKTDDISSTIILRDKKLAYLFIIGNGQIFKFKYLRSINSALEDIFIEKILAKINANLIKKVTNEIGFLEMFDSLPEIDFHVLLTIAEQEAKVIEAAKNKELTQFFKETIENIIMEIKREPRNAGTDFIEQFEQIQNNLIK